MSLPKQKEDISDEKHTGIYHYGAVARNDDKRGRDSFTIWAAGICHKYFGIRRISGGYL